MSEDVLLPFARNLHNLPFESRKDAQVIFSHVFRFKPDPAVVQNPNPDPPILHYVLTKRPELIPTLCYGYDHRESAMVCGGILREALKHDSVAALILYHEPTTADKPTSLHNVDPNIPASGNGVFWKFFEWIDKALFEISADAFNTFRVILHTIPTSLQNYIPTNHPLHDILTFWPSQDILTKHKRLSSHFLLTNYDRFVRAFHQYFITSPSYVTKRQSLQLLSGLLLERVNYTFMQRYVESADHLKAAMQLLRDDRRMINYEGFHVFKVFVANPQKSPAVQKILITNRDRLLRFLPTFLDDRRDDAQFEDEKAYLIRMIEQLPSSQGVIPQQQYSQQNAGGPVVA